MAYPDDLLSSGEHVVIHRHPHWKMLIFPVFWLLVVVARREPFATYTAVVAANAKHGASAHRDEVLRMLRSLRGRRVE